MKAAGDCTECALQTTFSSAHAFFGMQAAFGLSESGPAAGARIFADLNWTSAMRAANAGVVTIMQRVVRHVVLMHVVPHHLRAPIGDGIDLVETEFIVPFHLAGASPVRRLIATDRCDPSSQAGKSSTQRFNFSESAALVRIAIPQCGPVGKFLLLGCQSGADVLDLDPVPFLDAAYQVIRFSKQEIGVDREN